MKPFRILTAHEWGLLAVATILFGICAYTVEGFLFYDGELDTWAMWDRSRHLVEIGLIAIPMTYIICTGGIDLSVGSLMILSAMAMGVAFRDWGWSLWAAVPFSILVGAVAGGFNGWLGSYLAIAPLVVTLATRALYRGLALGISQADPVSSFPTEFVMISEHSWGLVPYTFILMVVLILVGHLFFRKSWIGRYTVAIGTNENAADFAAIPTKAIKFGLYTFSGVMCGIAAPIYVARFATANPEHASMLELDVIAAVVVGGTRITGGSGSVLGTGLGLLIVGMLRFALDLKAVSQQHQTILMGLVVIVMAVLNEWTTRRARTG
ncbi:MAG: ABC transporter permease [Candidatus Omnitrophica bacterium]|nr:ABC transporter permease [Candidatus Omnitrophota bacterium]